MTDHTRVPNPRRRWLLAAQKDLDSHLDALGDCLDDAKTAVASGAWKGTKGDAWAKELTGRAQTLSRGAESVSSDLATSIAAQPHEVCKCQVSPLAGFDYPLSDYPVLGSCPEGGGR